MVTFMEPKKAAVRRSLDEVVGERVHLLMWKSKMTQTAMASQMGIDQSSLSKRLRGERGWSLEDLESAASILGVGVADLLDRTPVHPPGLEPGTHCFAGAVCIYCGEREDPDYLANVVRLPLRTTAAATPPTSPNPSGGALHPQRSAAA